MSMSTRTYNDLTDFKCKIKTSECEECNGDMIVWEDKTSKLSTIEYGYGQHEDYHAVCIDCGTLPQKALKKMSQMKTTLRD